jgi:hypothetical protein
LNIDDDDDGLVMSGVVKFSLDVVVVKKVVLVERLSALVVC